jgi:predicted acylesterase/phospholipase RssA
MSIKNFAIACQGGGSHAAFAAGALPALLPHFANTEIAAAGARQQSLAEDGRERMHLTGISGTSGGAISALLAWYGYLTGGPQVAQSRLEQFWDANCAHQPGERLVNDMVQWMGNMAQFDLKMSPYLPPLRDIEAFAENTWPLMTAWWPMLGQWIRGHHFQLRESVQPHVDFELVSAIGQFCSIPRDAKRWLALELEEGMFHPHAPRQESIRTRQHAVEEAIRQKVGAAAWIKDRLARNGIPADALLRVAFDAWVEPQLVFDPAGLDRLSTAVKAVSFSIPQLLIGAVDVDSGAFVAFSSERAPADAGVTLDAVVASASLPWVFMAQVIVGTDAETQDPRSMSCWDGLLSQNPPIKNFISSLSDRSKKPDGIWILQINQDRFDFSKRIADPFSTLRSGGDLWHRRDTLSGNLSLNQEVAFIEAVNQRLDDPGQRFRPTDKPIEVARIVMDGSAVEAAVKRRLGLFSKFDRDPALEQALLAHGLEQADKFLSLRSSIDRLCEELAHTLEASGARPSARLEKAYPWLAGRGRIFGGLLSPGVVTIDRIPLDGAVDGPAGEGDAHASLRWHVNDAVVDGRTVRIKGSTSLWLRGGVWQLGETHLLNIEEVTLAHEADSAEQAARAHPSSVQLKPHGEAAPDSSAARLH